jgi:hypothetical protein
MGYVFFLRCLIVFAASGTNHTWQNMIETDANAVWKTVYSKYLA